MARGITVIWAMALSLITAAGAAKADGPANLLDLARIEPSRIEYTKDGALQVARLVDGDPGTTAIFSSPDGTPVDLLFAFDQGPVAPDSYSVTLAGDGDVPAPVRIDVLASTVSPSSGFSSLRTDRIDPLRPQLDARFASASTLWLRVRLFPAQGATELALGDISIGGREGLPETSYAFGETPAAALDIIGAIESIGAVDLALTPAEKEIFALAARGRLSTAEFVTVALLASGVTDPAARARYLAQVESLAAEARILLDLSKPPRDSGAELLEWLHLRALTGGYRERQTDLSVVLDDGVFNCVSSAVLFNAVAGQLGFDVRAIEVPDHAFSILYDGLAHMDVETTTPKGFNPRRDKVAEFEALTGFRYIPQSNISKRREIGAAGLVALIYYNHGVAHLKAGRYQQALFANFRAMSLDAGFASAATNALAALGQWSASLAEDGHWRAATEIAALGFTLAPQDRGLAANRKAIWQRWAFFEGDAGRPKAALAVLAEAARVTGDASFDAMRSAVLTRPAERLIKAGKWQGALDATATAQEVLDAAALADLAEWRSAVFRRWAHAELDQGRFDRALEVLTTARQTYSGDSDLPRTIRYLAQEWARALTYRDGLDVLARVAGAMPGIDGLDDVAKAFVQRHLRQGPGRVALADALSDAGLAAGLIGAGGAAELGAYVYETYGHARIDAQDWARAAEVYSAGRRAFPDSRRLARNARFVAQEWQRQASADGGMDALSQVQAALRALFPEFAVDPGFGEDEIVRQVNAALRRGDYAGAEDALSTAQLLIRPETYLDLRMTIFDRQAQLAMKRADWAQAATVYADARSQMADSALFANNIAYIAQEWTAAAAKSSGAGGVAEALTALTALFPRDRDVAGMGLRTLRRMVAEQVKAGAFAAAEQTIRDAQSFLPKDEVGTLIVTLHSRMAAQAIEAQDWPAALRAYAQGLQIVPGSRDLSRNLPHVFQEWSRQSLQQGGAKALVAQIDVMRGIYPGATALEDVLENVLGREVTARIKGGDPQGALDLIRDMQASVPQDLADDLNVLAYDRWARSRMDAGDWAEAIRIYDLGLLEVPQSRQLGNNRDYAQSKL